MAVLIQQMITPDLSFIMHTVNPTNKNPDEMLIEGEPPSNWRQHKSAAMLEAKAIIQEHEPELLELLAGGDWKTTQRSPLVGVSDIQKDSKRHNKIKGLQACLQEKRAKGRKRGKGSR